MTPAMPGGGDSEDMTPYRGLWDRNLRAALTGRRGRQALADLRDALLALPEPRLIAHAVCTVGGPGAKLPSLDGDGRRCDRRERARDALAQLTAEQGEGVCAIGAYVWRRAVRLGAEPGEAFGALPGFFTGDEDGDSLHRTAMLGQAAGLTYTLARAIAWRNDQTYGDLPSLERHAAFLAWIDATLAAQVAA